MSQRAILHIEWQGTNYGLSGKTLSKCGRVGAHLMMGQTNACAHTVQWPRPSGLTCSRLLSISGTRIRSNIRAISISMHSMCVCVPFTMTALYCQHKQTWEAWLTVLATQLRRKRGYDNDRLDGTKKILVVLEFAWHWTFALFGSNAKQIHTQTDIQSMIGEKKCEWRANELRQSPLKWTRVFTVSVLRLIRETHKMGIGKSKGQQLILKSDHLWPSSISFAESGTAGKRTAESESTEVQK